MHRLFVALPIPEPVADLLLDLEGGSDKLRWVHAEQLHLTLRFIGEVDGAQAEDIAAALSSIAFSAFTLRVDGTGCLAPRRPAPLASSGRARERRPGTLPPRCRRSHSRPSPCGSTAPAASRTAAMEPCG